VALFSLDKAEAIPVDTHVLKLAVRHYTPHLAGKATTTAVIAAVQTAFVDRFGSHAGW
jgi:3-methyladenine DNA glycosylase/8-oxoguanine DNA glycosylase